MSAAEALDREVERIVDAAPELDDERREALIRALTASHRGELEEAAS